MQLCVELRVPRNYSVSEIIHAAIEELNVKVVSYRLLNQPELFDLLTTEPDLG